MDSQFSLTLSQPLLGHATPARKDRDDFSIAVSGGSFSSTLPGGFNSCKLTLAPRYQDADGHSLPVARFPRDPYLQGFEHLTLFHAAESRHPIWEGRVLIPSYQGAWYTAVTASGYGLTATQDATYQQPYVALADTTAGQIIRTLVAQLAPTLQLPFGQGIPPASPGLYDSLITHSYSEFYDKAPYQIVDQLSKEAGLDWAVWDNRTLYVTLRQPPQTPDYAVNWDETVQADIDVTNTYSSVRVTYTSIDSSSPKIVMATDRSTPPFTARYSGLTRTITIQGGKLRDTAAQAFADAWIAVHTQPILKAQVTRTAGAGLTTPTGAEVFPWLVRAGQWVQLGGDQGPRLPIVQSNYDLDRATLTLTLGAPLNDIPSLLYESMTTRQSLILKITPTTGATVS